MDSNVLNDHVNDQNASGPLVKQAGVANVWELFLSCARAAPDAIALIDDNGELTYRQVTERASAYGDHLIGLGFESGDRLSLLSRNRNEYLIIELAAARHGIILAALNWRLSTREQTHCIELVAPKLLIAETDLLADVERLDLGGVRVSTLESFDHDAVDAASTCEEASRPSSRQSFDLETGLVILYTSGTTGLPKGALISHRAMIARAQCFVSELALPRDSGFVAWAPLYHMASTDHSLATLMRGGTVYVVDGYQPKRLISLLESVSIGWFVLMPGMVGDFAKACAEHGVQVHDTKVCGAMADLVPREDIAAVTTQLGVPYLNTFGATETGLPPATGALIAPGSTDFTLSKRQSAFVSLRLVDPDDHDVESGQPGEVALRGSTLFSGYWNAAETNAHDFRNGWFHMGDVMRRNADGTLDYVDRAKYLIKSGGENIYPAEIEQVAKQDERVVEAVAIRQPDAKWGEVPVLLVVPTSSALTSEQLREGVLSSLSRYKQPRDIHFVDEADISRSTTGKIQRHILETRYASRVTGDG
ncbi:MAG: class I adenylate-forming enzyme family protein [Pseudomonadota bacterium]